MLGFIGLGLMGLPMAQNLARAGVPLVVWNRTAASCIPLVDAGARAAPDPQEVFRSSDDGVILMLADEAAMDAVLQRESGRVGLDIQDRIIISMGTFSPAYAVDFARDVEAAGGRYVEAPVSGSRGPAENGELVGMLAGRDADLAHVRPLLAPVCSHIFVCGKEAGDALRMKLAANLYLIAMVASLAEAANLAKSAGLDLDVFARVIAAGPLSSPVAVAKLNKLCAADWSPQATLRDVYKNAYLVQQAAREANAHAPLTEAASALFKEAANSDLAESDMIAVTRLYAERTERLRRAR